MKRFPARPNGDTFALRTSPPLPRQGGGLTVAPMATPLRVLHVIDSLGLGGAQTVVLNLARHADPGAIRPEVLSLHGPGPFEERLRGAGIPTGHLGRSRKNPLLPLRFVRAIRERQPDVLHLHLVVSCLLGEFLRPLLPKRCRVVSHVHNVFGRHDEDAYQDRLERLLYRRCDATVACGAFVERSIREGQPRGARGLRTIPNGVDDALLQGRDAGLRRATREALGVNADTPLLLSASRLMRPKNLAYGLRVFAAARATVPEATYLIAGSGPLEASLRAEAESLGLGDSVRFLGFRNDVPALLCACDVFFLPSLHEGLPMALVEAIGAGAAAVVTPFDSHEEVIPTPAAGLTVPFDNATGAGDLLASLLADEPRRVRMAASALAHVREHLSASVMARRMESLYRELCGGNEG